MTDTEPKIRIALDCENRSEFRRLRMGAEYREEFPAAGATGLSEGDTVGIELFTRDGEVLIAGTAMVARVMPGLAMVALVEISVGERELQKEAWGKQLTESMPAATAPPLAPQSSSTIDTGPSLRSRWGRAVIAAGVVAAIVAAVALVFIARDDPQPISANEDAAPLVDPTAEDVREKLAIADQQLEAGRFVGPGENALDTLLQARKLAPKDPVVQKRLSAIADRFQQLADEAVAEKALVEAATHLQVVIIADPARDTAIRQMAEIEAQIRGRGPVKTPESSVQN